MGCSKLNYFIIDYDDKITNFLSCLRQGLVVSHGGPTPLKTGNCDIT